MALYLCHIRPILRIPGSYLGFLTWRVDSVLLKSFSTYGSLSCQSSLQQVSLWTCLTCEFILQDFTNKSKIFSFSRIQDKILINNSFLSGMRNAFYMHFLCIFEVFFMHFICISYAFYMHVLCISYALFKNACLFIKNACLLIKNACLFKKCI